MTFAEVITPSPPPTLDQVKYLVGPIALTEYYSSKYNKHIFLFSDEHQRKPKCPLDATVDNTISISDVIHLLIEEDSSKTINVYLEIPYISESKDRQKFSASTGYIADVASAFSPCFLVEKKNCPYSNVRFHYVDIRHWQNQKYMIDRQYLEVYLRLAISDFEQGKKLSDVNLQGISKYRWAFEEKINVKELLDRMKITKQIQNIPEKEVRDAIFNELVPKLENVLPTNPKWMLDMALRHLMLGKPKGSIGVIYMSIDSLQNFGVILMDMYVLSRMFRTFGKEPRSERDIVYAGATHIEMYDKILVENLGFEKLQSSQDSKDTYQCIDVSNFAPYIKFKI
jgi:hypothetical protein